MIGTDLTTARVRLADGGTAVRYPWRGEEVLVRDDAATVLGLVRLLQGPEEPGERRGERVLEAIFVSWQDAYTACDYDRREFGRLVDRAVWDVCGVDLSGSRPHERPLWDPEEDAAAIRASLRMAYGVDWDADAGTIPFAEFVALVAACPVETPLGRAIHYRDPRTRPKPTKHNRKAVEEWDRLHRALALGRGSGRGRDAAAGTDAAMIGAFEALRRKAV